LITLLSNTTRFGRAGVGAGWAAQQKGASEENREYLQAVEKRDTEMVCVCEQAGTCDGLLGWRL